jgi:hypothetical protein
VVAGADEHRTEQRLARGGTGQPFGQGEGSVDLVCGLTVVDNKFSMLRGYLCPGWPGSSGPWLRDNPKPTPVTCADAVVAARLRSTPATFCLFARCGGGRRVLEKMFSREQYEQWRSFPVISRDELFRYFTLTSSDVAFVDPDAARRTGSGSSSGPAPSWHRARSLSEVAGPGLAGRGLVR